MKVLVGVGSQNRAKVSTVQAVFSRIFADPSRLLGMPSLQMAPAPTVEVLVEGFAVASDVASQPLSAASTIVGAENRAKKALAAMIGKHGLQQDTAAAESVFFGVGLEGGVEVVGSRYFECGWMFVCDSNGNVGIGSSPRFEMSGVLMKPLLEEGKELAEVIDQLSGLADVRSDLGAMGILTNGFLGRQAAYESGLTFTLAPWLSPAKYWRALS